MFLQWLLEKLFPDSAEKARLETLAFVSLYFPKSFSQTESDSLLLSEHLTLFYCCGKFGN